MSRISDGTQTADTKTPDERQTTSPADINTEPATDAVDTVAEFEGLDNDLVNVGKFNDTAAPPKPNDKDPNLAVAEAFDINQQNLHETDESDELKEAVASLS